MEESLTKICKICQVQIGQKLPEIDLNPIICEKCKTQIHESTIKELNHIDKSTVSVVNYDLNCIKEELDVENMKEEFDVGVIKEEVCEDETVLVNTDIPVCIDTLLVPISYGCLDCGFLLDSKKSLIQHIYTHHKTKESQGTQCDSSSNTDSQTYKCQYCSFSTTINSELKLHVIGIHGNNNKPHRKREKTLKCPGCNFKCYQYKTLRVHRCKHFGEKPFKCDKCDFTCANNTYLRRHVVRTHTEEKNYKCDKCEYVTTCKPLLHTHMWSHTPYRCTECNYGCSYLSNFRIHMRKHTGEKPFQCDKCNYTSSNKRSLKAHYTCKHNKEECVQSYKCIECEYITTSKVLLVAHKLMCTKVVK